MRGVNLLTIAGNLGSDPETRTTGSGTTVANLSVGVTTREKRQGEWTDHTEWFRIVCWSSLAEACAKFLRKGAPVLVVGRLRTEEWTDKDGNKRRAVRVYADQVTFLGSGQRDGQQGGGGSAGGNQGGTSGGDESGYGGGGGYGGGAEGPYDSDSDIPF